MFQYQAKQSFIKFLILAIFMFANVEVAVASNKNIAKDAAMAATVGNPALTDVALQAALGDIGQNKAGSSGATTGTQAKGGTTATNAQSQQPVTESDFNNPDSAVFKANALARERKLEIQLRKNAGSFAQEQVTGISVAPPRLQDLQNISDAFAQDSLDAFDALRDIASADMRKEAQRNAALSYGARGGLAKRSFEIMERMDDYASVLDNVFDFKTLLIKAPSGMLIEPPIIKESLEAVVIKNGGAEAALADSVFDINKNARIVTAPRDWRQYLIQNWSANVPPPPKVLWPQDDKERADWRMWVRQGWEAGEKQAEQIFELNTNKLSADYKGMVRYRILLAQGMVSAPYTTHEERGVVGDNNQMRVGDRAIRITEPSRFLTGAEIWRPADR